ncbi:hypothetical protein LCGC14_1172090 [marine sediment metagenome]|uniref:Uncharacterized protein n=1 Tax=marine sediment metagenome TaxID=412755 RepID=A0A0F9P7M3_9ZZZZ
MTASKDFYKDDLGQENVEYAIYKALRKYRDKNLVFDSMFWSKVIGDLIRKYDIAEKYDKALEASIKLYEGKPKKQAKKVVP